MNNYMQWLFAQRSRQDPVGDLARDAFTDLNWNGKIKALEAIVLKSGGQTAIDAFDRSRREYSDQRKRY